MSTNTGLVRVQQHNAYEIMRGQAVTITAKLARTVAEILATEPPFVREADPAVTIAWHCTHDVEEWLVTFDAGYGTLTYLINDETGAYQLAPMGERA